MKKIYLILAVVIVYCHDASSQNLAATIENAYAIYKNGVFRPFKSGSPFSFNIKIVNNGHKTESVYIDKSGSFMNPDWVTVYSNSARTIKPDKWVIFSVYVMFPDNATDGYKANNLNLYIKNDNGDYISKMVKLKTGFLVDNTPPTNVSVTTNSVTETSFKVSVYAYDEVSSIFTSSNYGSGQQGVEQFDIYVKTMSGTTVVSKSIGLMDSWNGIYISGSSINPNTKYKVYAKATDLAGNVSADEFIEVRTASAAPTGLHTSDITYFSCRLNWNASDGATGYEIYDVTGSNPVHIGSTSSTHMCIEGLEPGTTYKYAIKTVSAGGKSKFSATIVVATETVSISGSSTVCESENYSVTNLLTGASVQWSVSNSNVASINSSGELHFKPWNYGATNVIATITFEGDNFTVEKQVNVGHPVFEIINIANLGNGSFAFFASPKGTGDLYNVPLNYHWSYKKNGSYYTTTVGNYMHTSFVNIQPVINFPESGYYTVQMKVTGTECYMPLAELEFYVPDYFGPFSLYPNPADNVVNINLNNDKAVDLGIRRNLPNYQIQIWNNYTLIKTIATKSLQTEIPISDLKTGYYYVVVTIDGKKYKQQFFKQ